MVSNKNYWEGETKKRKKNEEKSHQGDALKPKKMQVWKPGEN